MEDFSHRLQKIMADQALNQSDLARRMRTTQATVSRWISGTIPRRRMLDDLCVALAVDRRYLVAGDATYAPSVSNPAVLREDSPPLPAARLNDAFHAWEVARLAKLDSVLGLLKQDLSFAGVVEDSLDALYKNLAYSRLDDFFDEIQVLRASRPPVFH